MTASNHPAGNFSSNSPDTRPLPNLSVLRGLPSQLGVDALVVMSPENFTYTANVLLFSLGTIRGRHAFAILPANREPLALVNTVEYWQMCAESWIKDIRSYQEFVDYPGDALADALIDIGLKRGTIGIDLEYVPAALHARLAVKLPDVQFVDIGKNIAAIRAVKSKDEINIIEHAARQTHQAALDAMTRASLGETERTMANRIVDGITNSGADKLSHLIFASGERTSAIHGFPTERVPKKSEIIRFDIGGRYGAWSSDFARTYSTGEPTLLQQETYRKLWEIYTSTIKMFRAGMATEEPYFFYMEQVKKAGLNGQPWLGHSFGVETHEYPMVRPGEKAKIEVGMVFNIEPYVRDSTGMTYEFEDSFVITEQGPRLLTLGFPPPEIPAIGQPIEG
ncbi:Xaa-Pro peptidase family protein [Bradyrhizobium sp. CCBAU 51753]|uniref:M24 family metallopeptidase n=1 Tax=Bradyrhizobium sp. CCBAU 51753 TaxID=1325100 RepID=UPI00188D0F42|nr:Xaa-Pro peptidase family protein [Bradyrhizobium sp. CCBAU 51753]QOZ23881.1 hypothetical protein XH93_09815 [Bradyrhizobium sp. CCBAU 51753]